MPATGSQVVPVMNPNPNRPNASPEFTRTIRPIATISPATVTADNPVDVRKRRSAIEPDRPVRRRLGTDGAVIGDLCGSDGSEARKMASGAAAVRAPRRPLRVEGGAG